MLPRPAINWRRIFTVAFVTAFAAIAFVLGRELVEVPVRKLEVEGSFQRVTKLEVLAAAEPALDQGLLTLDLDEIRRRVTAIDWVDSVTLKRVWPDTLRITYLEHHASASWGDTGLLNTRGELFAEDIRQEYRELPRLNGPSGSHRRVAAMYLNVRDRLSRAGLILESITMDDRGSFSMTLSGGIEIRIGREDIDGRLKRFFDVALRSLAEDFRRVTYVDLRYPNGFAVGWRDTPDSGPLDERLASRG